MISDESGVPWHDADEPTAAELSGIEREMPVIEAEIRHLDAEIRLLIAEGRGPSQLDQRQLRRARHNVLRAAAQVAGHARIAVDETREVA